VEKPGSRDSWIPLLHAGSRVRRDRREYARPANPGVGQGLLFQRLSAEHKHSALGPRRRTAGLQEGDRDAEDA
jgi:hypothetical protein